MREAWERERRQRQFYGARAAKRRPGRQRLVLGATSGLDSSRRADQHLGKSSPVFDCFVYFEFFVQLFFQMLIHQPLDAFVNLLVGEIRLLNQRLD